MKDFSTLYTEAHQAGLKAASACIPTPMIVGSPSTPLGNDVDPSKPTYFVAGGVCGFAWINVKPGNCSFANWLKKQGKVKERSYYGGVDIWVYDFGQSMELKESYAHAFAKVLSDNGIRAYAMSRMD